MPQQGACPGRQGFEQGHVLVVRTGPVQAAEIDADARHMGARAMGRTLRRGRHGP